MTLVHEFVRQAALSPAELGASAKQRLTNLGAFLIGQVPASGLDPANFQQFQQKYTTIFGQRAENAARDIEVGVSAGKVVSGKDTDLQVAVLQRFYERRDEGWIRLPVNQNATEEEGIRITRICEQLGQKGLIEWKGIAGAAEGVGRIKVRGVEYIERGDTVETASAAKAPQRRKSEKFEILDSPKQIEEDIASASGILGNCLSIHGFGWLQSSELPVFRVHCR